jgi:hypothetical protein
MPECYTLVLRTPLAEAIGAPHGHMVANASQLGTINSIRRIVISIDPCNPAHREIFVAPLRS